MAACGSGAATTGTVDRTSSGSDTERSQFLAAPDSAGKPGEVIAATEVAPPVNGRAWIVDHHSTDVAGKDIAERAMLAVPMAEPPPGGFPLIVWGHASKGVADRCAPSLEGPAAVPLIDNMVAAGYAVVAPDYEGLGAAGTHAYMVGPSEGRAMLDSARAAMQVKASGVSQQSPIILWGFSQGGHAAAFAAEIAPLYAPELKLKGAAMAAPVTDVASFVKRAEGWPEQFGLLVTISYAFARTYPELRIQNILKQSVIDELDVIENQCVKEVTAYFNRPIEEMLVKTPRDDPDFSRRFQESLAGQAKVGVPVLVLQGNIDQIVDPVDTDALVRRYCEKGVDVSYLVRTGENHNILTDDVLLPWIRGRLVGDPAPNNCNENRSSRNPASDGP